MDRVWYDHSLAPLVLSLRAVFELNSLGRPFQRCSPAARVTPWQFETVVRLYELLRLLLLFNKLVGSHELLESLHVL